MFGSTRQRTVSPNVLSVSGTGWMQRGACQGADPDLFYADNTAGTAYADARKICNRCDVRDNCLAFALDNMRIGREEFTDEVGIGLFGVWGGTTPPERLRMIRRVAA